MTRLAVPPNCLMFFVDETGHESFSDPKFPVFGLGGCAIMAGAIDTRLKSPWRRLKADFFGDSDMRLHAADLRSPTAEQMQAIGDFFRTQTFGRFAVTMANDLSILGNLTPMEVMPGVLRRRWEDLISRIRPSPVEVALIHESSQRGDLLIERYFGVTDIQIEGRKIPVHHGFMPKSSDEALEVADFIVHTAGRQAFHRLRGRPGFRKDFEAVFQTHPLATSFIDIKEAKLG